MRWTDRVPLLFAFVVLGVIAGMVLLLVFDHQAFGASCSQPPGGGCSEGARSWVWWPVSGAVVGLLLGVAVSVRIGRRRTT